MLGLGVIGFAAGLYTNDERLWPSFLLNAFFFLSLALGAAVFVSINSVANAGWSTAIRRVPEAMISYLPLGSLARLRNREAIARDDDHPLRVGEQRAEVLGRRGAPPCAASAWRG